MIATSSWCLLVLSLAIVCAEPFDVFHDLSAGPEDPCPFPLQTYPLEKPSGPLAEGLRDIEKWLWTEFDAKKLTGMSMQIIYDGKPLLSVNAGARVPGETAPPTSDTPFRIASITKAFTALLAYQAVDDGLMQLGDPVTSLLSNFSYVDPFNLDEQITFRDLMAHVSGLQRDMPCLSACTGSTPENLEKIAESMLTHRIGEYPSYSNLGFAVLGHAVAEGAYDSTYAEILNENVIARLGLLNTGLNVTEAVRARMAVGSAGGSLTYGGNMHWTSPAGQMYASANDLSAVLSSLMGDDTLLSAPLRSEWLDSARYSYRDGTAFGGSWEIVNLKNSGYNILTKSGGIGGYSTEMSMIPSLKLGVVFLFNQNTQPRPLTVSVFEKMIPLLTAYLEPLQEGPVVSNPSWYVGTYRYPLNPAFQVSINYNEKANILGGTFRVNGNYGFYLKNAPGRYHDDKRVLQLSLPPQAKISCFLSAGLAFYDQYVYFDFHSVNATSVQVPGFFGDRLILTRSADS